jgi:hypothetical protein
MKNRRAALLDSAGPDLLSDAVRTFGEVRLRALGSSMSPAIRPRDILVVARCGAHDLRPHDVVVYGREGRLFAHRLLEVGADASGGVLRTRGDAVWRADAAVAASALLGRVVAVGRGGVFRPPAPCTRFARARGLIASECTALRVRIQR